MALEINEINSDILSASTIYSATTNLQDIIQNIVNTLPPSGSASLQNGLNTYTGGTSSLPTVNVSGGTFDNLTVTGTSSLSTLTGTSFFSAGTNLNSILKTTTPFTIQLFTPITSTISLTSQPLAEGFFISQATVLRNVREVDLSQFTQCRITVSVSTASTSVNNPRLLLKGKTGAFTRTVSDYVTLGENGQEVSVSLSGAGVVYRDSGWLTLNTTARTDNLIVVVTQIGGNGAATPVLNGVNIFFE